MSKMECRPEKFGVVERCQQTQPRAREAVMASRRLPRSIRRHIARGNAILGRCQGWNNLLENGRARVTR
jgi:hypothetical protein